MDYLGQTGHYFGLASKKTTASEPKPLFGGGTYASARANLINAAKRPAKTGQGRATGRVDGLVATHNDMECRVWVAPKSKKFVRAARANFVGSDKQPVPHRHRLLNLQRSLGRSASEPPKPCLVLAAFDLAPYLADGAKSSPPLSARAAQTGISRGCFRRFRAGTGRISRGTGFYLVRHGRGRSNRVH
jgi:hypothetical protein